MRMTEEQLRRERIYTSTMTQVKRLVKLNIIPRDDYRSIDTTMKEKYHPISDGLLVEYELLCAAMRA